MLYFSYLAKMIKSKLYSFHLILRNPAYPRLIQTLILTTISEASNHSCSGTELKYYIKGEWKVNTKSYSTRIRPMTFKKAIVKCNKPL